MTWRILFVDDEPRVLDGVRRTLRPWRTEWDVTFVTSGDAALLACEAGAFDIIVSDLRMPQMDGATLLARIAERWPQTVRVVLSGYAERGTAIRSLHTAHQFLAKPCDAGALQQVIVRATAAHALALDAPSRALAAGMHRLPACRATHQALADATGDLFDLAKRDAAIAAKLLQLANSSFFGPSRTAMSVGEALTVLGGNTARLMADSHDLVDQPTTNRAPGFCLEAHAAHAAAVASLASQLVTDRTRADETYTAALFHDIGQLVLASGAPERLSEDDTTSLGAYLLALWGIPRSVVDAVAYYRLPLSAPPAARNVAIAVHRADALVHERVGAA